MSFKAMRNSVTSLVIVLLIWGNVAMGQQGTVRRVTKIEDLPVEKQEQIRKENKHKAARQILESLKVKHAGKISTQLTQIDIFEWARAKMALELELD